MMVSNGRKDTIMLVIRREPGEEIHLIEETTEGKVITRIKVLNIIYGNNNRPMVRLGIEAPKDTIILREELTRNDSMQARDSQDEQES